MPLSETHTRLSVKVPSVIISPDEDEETTPDVVVSSSVDIELSKDLPMAQLVAEIVIYLREHAFDSASDPEGRYEKIRERLSDPYALWQLTSPTGLHYGADETITSAGLNDGDVLIIADSRQRENYRPLIDDTAEAVAHYQRMHFQKWVSAYSRTLVAWALPLVALAVAAVVVRGVSSGQIGIVGQYVGCAVFAFAAAMLLVGAARGLDQDATVDLQHLVAGAVTAGYVTLGAAGVLLVPDGWGAWAVLLAAVLVASAAAVMNGFLRFPESINYAALSLGVIVGVGGLIAAVTGARPVSVCVGITLGAMAFMTIAQRLALIQSKIPMKYVPAQGETFVVDEDEDLMSFSAVDRNEVIASIVNYEAKVITARQAHVGMIWAALLAAAVCAGVCGAVGQFQHPAIALAFWTAVVLGLLFRAKVDDDAARQGSLLVGALVIALSYLIALALSGVSYTLVLIGAGLLAAGVIVAVRATVAVKLVHSPVINRRLESVEFLCWGSMAVTAAFVMDLFSYGRGLIG